jgi:16S rRNA (cytosine967-C5)-methyltransferase
LLDWYLSRFSKILFEKLDTEVKIALRLGAYQILLLDRIPVRAAIHESVEMVNAARIRSAKGFVNALLRKANRNEFEQLIARLSLTNAYGLSLRYSHPEWLVQRWMNRFDTETVICILEGNNRTPRTFLRLNSASLSWSELLQALQSFGIQLKASSLCEEILEVERGELSQTKVLLRHEVAIQDAASQAIAYLLRPEKTDVCLDLCAAPGGKSSQLAQLSKGRATVVALDRYWHRVRTMKILHGERWPNLRLVVADGTQPLPLSLKFDKVLVDAPCSGTGTLGRHPEIRWKLNPTDLAVLSQLQMALLENGSAYLKPGGLLVYSTCSLEPEENEQIIGAFLSKNPHFRLETSDDDRFVELFDQDKHFRLLPSTVGSDGFFAGLLRKSSDSR